MEMVEAISQAFEAQQAGSDLVKRLLTLEIKPSAEEPAIVVFTGYGVALADYAREVRREFSNAPILVLGPDNLCAAKKEEQYQDAQTYKTHIEDLDAKEKIPRRVMADASKDTQSTLGQATVAARKIEEEGFETALLVTAAYHQPRAYMTLLKSLMKRGIHERVKLVPKPYGLKRDWKDPDQDLKDNKPWADVFSKDELPRIVEYQRKGYVASWEELKEYLDGQE